MKDSKKNISIKLSQNENPLGSSPKALNAICEHSNLFSIYPEPHSLTIKNEIAKKLGLSPDSIFVSAGLIEALDILIRNFVAKDENIIVSECSFVAYRQLAKVFGAEMRFAKMDDYHLSVNHFLEKYDSKTSLIIIDNPNNPTGTFISKKDLNFFLQQVSKETLVVLDEAYCEYVYSDEYPNTLDLLNSYPNLIIMRSFSKIFGLAGLRVGYSISSPEIVAEMDYYQAPFTVSQVAALGSIAAINDIDFLKKSFDLNLQERTKFSTKLIEMGFKVVPTQSNFIFIPFENGEVRDLVFDHLATNNIIVRKTDLFGAEKAFRISIGLPAQNICVINSLEAYCLKSLKQQL